MAEALILGRLVGTHGKFTAILVLFRILAFHRCPVAVLMLFLGAGALFIFELTVPAGFISRRESDIHNLECLQ